MFNRKNNPWKEFFEWTKSEKRMAFVIVGLIFVTYGLSLYFKSIENSKEIHIAYFDSTEPENSFETEKFKFNPNTCAKNDFVKLGFKPFIADRIIKFRDKYGIYSENTLRKIYGIDTSLISQLSDWMYFELKSPGKLNNRTNKNNLKPFNENVASNQIWSKPKPKLEIELNTADTSQFKLLKGIGSKRAQMIVNYREKLGGFFSEKQLYEIWGLDSILLDSIISNTWVDNTLIRKIQINKVSKDELAIHPYISKKTATLIINYRKQHGVFRSKEDMYKQIGVNKAEIDKISPYLDFTD
jgi:DNA uptake protein ComE-like DNA-binding protein